jgi:mRNA interferase RelE/StbE
LAWTIKFDKKAKKELKFIDKPIQKQIAKFISKLLNAPNPKFYGEQLKGTLNKLWRYRVGDYRLICKFEDEVLIVIIVAVKHRKEAYK